MRFKRKISHPTKEIPKKMFDNQEGIIKRMIWDLAQLLSSQVSDEITCKPSICANITLTSRKLRKRRTDQQIKVKNSLHMKISKRAGRKEKEWK